MSLWCLSPPFWQLSPLGPQSLCHLSLSYQKLYQVKPLKSPLTASDWLRKGEEQVPSPQATSSIF